MVGLAFGPSRSMNQDELLLNPPLPDLPTMEGVPPPDTAQGIPSPESQVQPTATPNSLGGFLSQKVAPTPTPVPTASPTVTALDPVPSMVPEGEAVSQPNKGTPMGKQAEEPYETLPTDSTTTFKGGMQTTSTTKTNSKTATTKMAAHSKEQILKAHQTLAEFSNRVANLKAVIGGDKALKVEEAYNNYASTASKGYEDFERTFTKIQDDIDKVDMSLQDISTKKIDPNRYLSQMTNTDRVMNALAAGLEAGWNNMVKDPAMRMDYFQHRIEKAIQMDITLQEKELTQEKDYQTGKASLLRDKLKDFDSLAKAKNALSADMLKVAEGKILSWAEGQNALILPEEAQAITAENALKIAEKQADMISTTFDQETVSKTEPIKKSEKDTAGETFPSEYAVPLKNGKFAIMMSKEDAASTRASITTVDEVKGLLNRVLEIRQGMGPVDTVAGMIGTELNEKVALLKGLQSNIAGKLAQIKGLGALTGPDLQLVIDETGLLTHTGASVDAKISEMVARLDKEVAAKFETAYGFAEQSQILRPGQKP